MAKKNPTDEAVFITPEEQKAISWTMDYLITLIVHEGQTIGRDEIEKARFALRDSLAQKEEMDAEREKVAEAARDGKAL